MKIDWNKGSFYNETKKSQDHPSFGNWRYSDQSKFEGFLTKYKLLIQVSLAALVFAVGIAIHDKTDPVSVAATSGFKWLLSTDVDFEPILDKAVKIAFQGNDVEWPFLGETKVDVTSVATDGVNMAIPVSGTVNKQFGWAVDKIDDYPRFHEGIDIESQLGTPIKVVLDGQIRKIGEDKVLGKYVQVIHYGDYATLYAHLDKVSVKVGQLVQEGQQIGTVGTSGAVENPCLHFEVRKQGNLLDPLQKLQIKNGGV